MADMAHHAAPPLKARRLTIPPLYGIYLFLLIYVNVRYGGVAPYMMVAGLIAIYEGIRVGLFGKRLVFTRVDVAFALYIITAVISFIIVPPSPDALNIIIKTIAYYGLFFGIRQAIANDPNAEANLLYIAKGSLAITTAFIFFLMFYSGVKLIDLLSFNYYSFTFKIFQAMPEILGSEPLDRGVNVRRNSVSEPIVMFYMIVFGQQSIRYQLMAFFLVFVFQSRRAVLVVAIFVAARLRNVNALIYLSLAAFLAVLIWVAISSAGIDFSTFSSRLLDTDVSRRGAQYSETVELIRARPYFGSGFGAQIDGLYVHNFILSNFYMMGIPGLVVSLYFTGTLVAELFGGGKHRFLLLIPLASLMVAGTIEGLLIPSSWACVAIVQGVRMGAQRRA